MPHLAVVTAGQPLPEPPYPADTRARDWAFEINVERVWQSDTWALCPPDVRPWLWQLWIESWRCTPCGSYANDDQLIAARIGMPLNLFRAHREVLMRGWELHSDGRLYHAVVAERVLRMIGWRKSEAERKAAWRSRNQGNQGHGQDVPRDTHGTDASGTTPPPPPPPPVLRKDESPTDSSARPVDRAPACPHERIIELWNRVMVTSPKVDADRWHENHRRPLRTRWREVWEYEGKKGRARDTEALLLWWERLFRFCRESKFLMGQVPGRDGGPPFELTLPYLIGPKNLYRVISGEFHREGGKGR